MKRCMRGVDECDKCTIQIGLEWNHILPASSGISLNACSLGAVVGVEAFGLFSLAAASAV